MNKQSKELINLASRMLDTPNDFTTAEKTDVVNALNSLASSSQRWWVVVLKILAYAIGLVLGGAATTSCVHLIN